MATIQDTYINALLADATYAEDLADGLRDSSLRDVLSNRMTPPMAKFIAANFEVVAHNESDDTLGSGFDATVWRGKSGTPYAGRVFLSMQGTQGLSDFLADADLTLSGGARAQFVEMVNWWLRITTPVTEQARQIRQSEVIAGTYFEDAPAVQGTGQLVGVTAVEVNGHSLGGHLATAFARIFGGSVAIDHVGTFNSAGFTPLSAFVFDDLQRLLGSGVDRYLSEVQYNYFATHGINLTANSFFNSQIGTRVDLFHENSSAQEGPYVPCSRRARQQRHQDERCSLKQLT
jgi:trimeric autotransporter adhesin